MNNTPKTIHKLSVKRLGVTLIATAWGMSIVSAATRPSPDPLHLSSIATVTIVDGATDLGASGFVDGTVRHLESIHGHTSSQLASQVTEAVEEIGCNKVGTLTGHPESKTPNDTPMTTIIATQFDCGAYYAEIRWTTNEPGVDVVIGEPSPALVRR